MSWWICHNDDNKDKEETESIHYTAFKKRMETFANSVIEKRSIIYGSSQITDKKNTIQSNDIDSSNHSTISKSDYVTVKKELVDMRLQLSNIKKAMAEFETLLKENMDITLESVRIAESKAFKAEEENHSLESNNKRLEGELSSALDLISLNSKIFRTTEENIITKDRNFEIILQENELLDQENKKLKSTIDELIFKACRADELEKIKQNLEEELVEARPLIAVNQQLTRAFLSEQTARKKLHNEIQDLKGRIRVYVRVRPMLSSELTRGCEECTLKDGKFSISVKGSGYNENTYKTFDFNEIFSGSESNSQEDVFRDTKHLIMSVVDGYNVCIFAYGQTGSGKTYTMIGGADVGESILSNGTFVPTAGLLPRSVAELYRILEDRKNQYSATVEVQMFQLYRDKLEDLLLEKKSSDITPNLKIVLAEHSPSGLVEVDGAEKITAETAADVMRIVAFGSSRRTTASTQMNSESSRSHLICVLVVKLQNRRSKAVSIGKLTLVDLAGSERVDKSGATGEVLKEAQSINKSLSALGGVIASTSNGSSHIPYRDHPLTMLMSDSIGGNAKTLMFVNCSPADYNCNETINSLTFGSRCKDITNPVVAMQGIDLQLQITNLKRELSRLKRLGNPRLLDNSFQDIDNLTF